MHERVNLRLCKGQLIQAVGVSLLGPHDHVSVLGEEESEGCNELQVGGGGHVVVAAQLRQEPGPSHKQELTFADLGGCCGAARHTTYGSSTTWVISLSCSLLQPCSILFTIAKQIPTFED